MCAYGVRACGWAVFHGCEGIPCLQPGASQMKGGGGRERKREGETGREGDGVGEGEEEGKKEGAPG